MGAMRVMKFGSIRGVLDFKLGRARHFYPWGYAMNGMTSRLEAVRQIIFALRIEHIIETGTYRGSTAEWFAQFKLPIETVELIERYYAFSRRRLKQFHNVSVFLDASVPFLQKRISAGRVRPDAHQLFYLDSHWGNDLPLRQEIELIFNSYTGAVVIIDDFEVPDDKGYGFDIYSDKDRLTMPYLVQAKTPRPLIYFYPTTRSENETGVRRGWVVVTDNTQLASKLDYIDLIRRA